MNGSSVDERGKTHHGKSNLFQETPKTLCSTFLLIKIQPPSCKQNKLYQQVVCSTFLPTDVKHCLNVGYTFVNFATSEAVWKSHVCITRKSWPLFKSKKITQVVRAWIQKVMLVNALRRFRESLRRVTHGAEALLILTLFILCLDKVSTDHAKLVPLGKVCTAKETLEKNTAKVVNSFGRQLCSKTINNVRHITAKVAGKFVSISEASIRTDLIFDDVDGIDSLSNQDIFDAIQLMGYKGDLTVLSVEKPSTHSCATGEIPNESLPDSSSAQPSEIQSQNLLAKIPKEEFTKIHRMHKESISKQGRKKAKGESLVQRNPLFDVFPEDKIDHMETEHAQSEGRTREMVDEDKEFDEDRLSAEDEVSTDKEGVSTDFEKVSTDRPKVSTDGSKVSTDEQVEGTEEQKEDTEDVFEIKPSASKEKEKGVELKDVEEIDRPRPTSTRSLLTLKPLPKIDPKDKGKKKIEEEDESESEDDDIPSSLKKFKQLEIEKKWLGKRKKNGNAEEERKRF
ncbi:ribonuclease H-like domain-containing protein [Tanacetum coccineum]